ncbi:MAG: AmmeMemoRadiSam system protein B [Deltaproteobacteria bacterium]|nr:AmmeMemoRadiSam system protein B [Deltaproteobacteria bacterium]MBW2306465.1 AmmeMemoRadiSam system protein B [Deltaproteobacteria bacterium]
MSVKYSKIAVLLILAAVVTGWTIQKRPESESHRGGAVMEPIRKSVIAGSWYPGDPIKLRKDIEGYLHTVPTVENLGRVVALICPHAGYMYSGRVAAHAYKTLMGTGLKRVIVVAPSHRHFFKGSSVYNRGGYETPLGIVPVDETLCKTIMDASPTIDFVPRAHVQEHSLEIQLPFLQCTLGEFSLVPIVLGDQGLDNCRILADAIAASTRNQQVLLVASTDLSHFHPYDEATAFDQRFIERVKAFDVDGLAKDLAQTRTEACGGGPVLTVMLVARKMGAESIRVLHYANSGDVTGDRSSVVGYMAAVITQEKSHKPIERSENSPTQRSMGSTNDGVSDQEGLDRSLDQEEKETLLHVARETIYCLARREKPPLLELEEVPSLLREKRGAFVTLHKGRMLRGCIGYIQPIKPLVLAIQEMAEAAAFRDPRFPPITADELDDLDIEISVLTPLRCIKDVNEIQVGKHGIYISKGYRSGILLPQVATEQGWDRQKFLEHTCLKAGLPKDAWKDSETEIKVFSAEIF